MNGLAAACRYLFLYSSSSPLPSTSCESLLQFRAAILVLAVPEGLEPPTHGVENRCSCPLSYGTKRKGRPAPPCKDSLDVVVKSECPHLRANPLSQGLLESNQITDFNRPKV